MLARLSRAVALCCALACSLLFAVSPALAAMDTIITGTDFWTLIQPFVVDVGVAVLTVLGGWLFAMIKRKFGLDIDAKNRDALHSAAVTGINLALAKLGTKLQGTSVDVHSAVIASAIQWVEKSVPDALSHFGVTPATLDDLVVSKLTQVLGSDGTATAPAASASAASASGKPARA